MCQWGRYILDAIALAERSKSNGGGFETRPYQFLQHKRETSPYKFVPPELERYRVIGGMSRRDLTPVNVLPVVLKEFGVWSEFFGHTNGATFVGFNRRSEEFIPR